MHRDQRSIHCLAVQRPFVGHLVATEVSAQELEQLLLPLILFNRQAHCFVLSLEQPAARFVHFTLVLHAAKELPCRFLEDLQLLNQVTVTASAAANSAELIVQT